MKVKINVPVDDLIALWVDMKCDEIAPSCTSYTHDAYEEFIEIEFSDEDTEEDNK